MPHHPRGSEWRRWDLHVHSPLSILSNGFPHTNGQPDWESYVIALERQPVAVYGITDYFTIDGYKELRRLQASGRLAGKTLLPNIEFRLDQLLNVKGDRNPARRLNFHVMFSDEVDPRDIEDHFLHDLDFVHELHPNNPAMRKRLKTANLIELGEELKQQDSSFRQPAIQVGAMTAVVKLDNILDALRKDRRFKDRYLILLPAQYWDEIPWGGQDHLVRKLLLQSADIVMASNPKTVSWCLGERPYTDGPAHFMTEFRTLKPCVHGSDAHAIKHIGHPCSKRSEAGHDCAGEAVQCDLRHCWIKADPTFEGLRQLLYEPRDRVCIQSADPTPSKSLYSIEGITIDRVALNNELTVDGVDLPLNANMVAVTGGKGSGKTALADLLAHAFNDREKTADKNSFVRRIAGEPKRLRFTLRFSNGKTFSKEIGDDRFFEDSSVAYIAQGELEKYIDENSDLNQYVHRLIFGSATVRNSVSRFDFESLTDTTLALQKDIDETTRIVFELEMQTSESAKADIERQTKQARAELEDATKRVSEAEAHLSKEKIDANNQTQQQVGQLKTQRDQLTQARDIANQTIRFLDTELQRTSASVNTLNQLIGRLGLGDLVAEVVYPDRERIIGIKAVVDQRVRDAVTKIERYEQEIRKLDDDLKDHSKWLSKKEELASTRASLQQQDKQMTARQQELAAQKRRRSDLFRALLRTTLAQREKYTEMIGSFASEKEPILKDLDFLAHVTFDTKALLAVVEDLVDNRQVEIYGKAQSGSVLDRLNELLTAFATGDNEAVEPIAAEVDRLASELSNKLKKTFKPDAICLALFRSYLSVHPAVLFKKTPLDRLSLGQKATVLIKIYLAEGDHPIIIDSHDDHLDNEYIMDELVGAIRHAKLYRQVILASNNGNVVVNSDAEQVIVARRLDGTITYSPGSLEDPNIREIAVTVLKGGSDAFKKRQQKYRMT